MLFARRQYYNGDAFSAKYNFNEEYKFNMAYIVHNMVFGGGLCFPNVLVVLCFVYFLAAPGSLPVHRLQPPM